MGKINIYWQRFKTPEQRFWELVDKSGGSDACWPWMGGRRKGEYGAFRKKYKDREQISHRHAWIFTNGEIPNGKQVLHHCDNPPCCNPAHLFLGTAQDNMDDKTKKSRNNPPIGERAAFAKLTERDVLEIRTMHATGNFSQRKLGEIFNIGYKAICKIVHRQRWKHI